MPIVLKSGSLQLLEPSGPIQGCNGTALNLIIIITHPTIQKQRILCITRTAKHNYNSSISTVRIQLLSISTVGIQLLSISTVRIQLLSISTVRIQLLSISTVRIQLPSISTVRIQLPSISTVRIQLPSISIVRILTYSMVQGPS